LREATVDAGLDAADIDVVDLASIPARPSSLSPIALGFIGLAFGLFGGAGLALFMDRLDTKLYDAREIQDLLNVPVLAVVPTRKAGSEAKQLQADASTPELIREPNSQFSESIRSLRTAMILSGTSRGSRIIGITSCQASEGKTTTSANLACGLAQSGRRVILIEADMRRPNLHRRLGLRKARGLSEYLANLNSLDEVIQRASFLDNLDAIVGGAVPPLPSDLLGSDIFNQLLSTLRARYDYIIIDTPPLLSVTDTCIVGSQADGMIFVIRQGFCTRGMLLRAREMMADLHVKVYGFVLNRADFTMSDYYAYYSYGYGRE
jgi:capsular exopolysaccharide synthesis family protein